MAMFPYSLVDPTHGLDYYTPPVESWDSPGPRATLDMLVSSITASRLHFYENEPPFSETTPSAVAQASPSDFTGTAKCDSSSMRLVPATEVSAEVTLQPVHMNLNMPEHPSAAEELPAVRGNPSSKSANNEAPATSLEGGVIVDDLRRTSTGATVPSSTSGGGTFSKFKVGFPFSWGGGGKAVAHVGHVTPRSSPSETEDGSTSPAPSGGGGTDAATVAAPPDRLAEPAASGARADVPQSTSDDDDEWDEFVSTTSPCADKSLPAANNSSSNQGGSPEADGLGNRRSDNSEADESHDDAGGGGEWDTFQAAPSLGTAATSGGASQDRKELKDSCENSSGGRRKEKLSGADHDTFAAADDSKKRKSSERRSRRSAADKESSREVVDPSSVEQALPSARGGSSGGGTTLNDLDQMFHAFYSGGVSSASPSDPPPSAPSPQAALPSRTTNALPADLLLSSLKLNIRGGSGPTETAPVMEAESQLSGTRQNFSDPPPQPEAHFSSGDEDEDEWDSFQGASAPQPNTAPLGSLLNVATRPVSDWGDPATDAEDGDMRMML